MHWHKRNKIVRMFRQGFRVWKIAEDTGLPTYAVMGVLRRAGHYEMQYKGPEQRRKRRWPERSAT